MELRHYWQIVLDRKLVILGTFLIAGVVAAASVFLAPQTTSSYEALTILAVKPEPLPATGNYYFSDDYYSYVASEYTNDDLIKIIEGESFMQAVRGRLSGLPGGAPTGQILAEKAHRVLEIRTSAATESDALRLAQAVTDLLTGGEAQSQYFGLFTNRRETVSIADAPRIVAQPTAKNPAFNLVARMLVGLGAGFALAFLLEYLDDTVRSDDLGQLLGWPILAEIPGRGLPREQRSQSSTPRPSSIRESFVE